MAVSLDVKSTDGSANLHALFSNHGYVRPVSVTIIWNRWPRCLRQIIFGFDSVLHRAVSY